MSVMKSVSAAARFALLVGLGWASTAQAEGTRFYNLEGFGSFLDGNPESTAVSEDGLITLPPVVKERFADPAATFSAAVARGDDIIAARARDGQIVVIDKAGKIRDLVKLEESLVSALIVTEAGLYAAAGPPAKLYRIDDKGVANQVYTGEASYIWALAAAPKRGLYAVTGEPGKVLKFDEAGKATELWKSDQAHLRAIAFDPTLGLFVGGGERGVVYRAANEKDFRALYDTGLPEVTSVLARGGYAYAAGVQGADALASDEGGGGEGKRGKAPKAAQVRSVLIRVAMDGAVETLAGSSDEAIFAMTFDAKERVVVATGAAGRDDPRGRLYAVVPGRREISMIYQAPSQRITALVPFAKGGYAAVAAAGGRIVDVQGGTATSGDFVTMPFDASINSTFGALQIFGSWPSGTKVTGSARTGQTAVPDETWSKWSPEVSAPGGVKVDVTNGRYAQVRVRLSGDGKSTPAVSRVRLAYLRQNLAPSVREVVALHKGLALIPVPREEQKSKTISLSDKGGDESRRAPSRADGDDEPRSSRARQVEQRGALTLRWVADDPNGDALTYGLDVRPLGRGEWRKVSDELDEPFYTLQSTQLPDGHYQFRVRVTDAPSNPRGAELSDVRESNSVLVDNSPPRVDSVSVKVDGKRGTVRVAVVDAVGPLVTAELSVDGGDFRPMLPDDGVLDGAGESFTVRLPTLESGSHTATVRVVDEADNEGFGEASFSVP